MTKNTRLALAFVVLVLPAIVALVFLLRSPSQDAAHDVSARPAAETPSKPAEPTPLAPELAEPPRETASVASTVKEPIDAPTTAVPAALPADTLHGTLVLDDPERRVGARVEGELTLQFDSGGGSEGHRLLDVSTQSAAVVGDSWTLRIERERPATRFLITELRFGDVLALVEEPKGFIPLPASGAIEIRARVPRRSVLRVVDALSGADLRHVVLVSGGGFPENELHHPGSSYDRRIAASDLVSPIDLDLALGRDPMKRSSRLLVGAPEHAWTRVEIDFSSGGERIVSLARGGTLEIQVSGLEAGSHPRLRVRNASASDPLVDQGLRSEVPRVVLAGLEPGKLRISAELGDWWEKTAVLGSTEVVVVAGETAQATLALERAPVIDSADIAGVLLVPKAWGLKSARVTTKYLGTASGRDRRRNAEAKPATAPRPDVDAFAWSLKRLEVGKHEFSVHAPPFSVVIEVPPGGRSDFGLEIAPPCDVSVRVVSAETNENVEVEMLHWNPRRPEGVGGGSLEQAVYDAQTKRYSIRAPCAPIDVQVWDMRFEAASATLDPAQGERETTLTVKLGCGLVVRLRDGDAAVPFPDDWHGELEAAPGTSGRTGMTTYTEAERRYQVTEPGAYTLKLPRIPGYREPDLLTIVVRAHEFTEQVVQLEREH